MRYLQIATIVALTILGLYTGTIWPFIIGGVLIVGYVFYKGYQLFKERTSGSVIVLDPPKWYGIFLPLAVTSVSFLATVALSVVLTLVILAIEVAIGLDLDPWPFSFNIWYLVWISFLVLGALPLEGEGDTVPDTKYVAIVTWLGKPLGWLLRETGHYAWTGAALGFGRTERVLGEKRGGFTDEQGYVKFGSIQFRVWDHSSSDASRIISAPAKNRAMIKGTLILVMQATDPRTILDADDPALDIGERARQEFREMVGGFVDTDVPGLQQVTGDVLKGVRFITCFMPKAVGGHKAGAMMRDNGGQPMFRLVEEGESKDEAMAALAQDILNRGNEEMLEVVAKKLPDGQRKVKIDTFEVETPIWQVVEKLGLRLERVSFGDIILSQPVTEAANKASAETDERIAQEASARSQKKMRGILLPDEKERANPAWETAMVIAAAQDNPEAVQVNHLTGGDPMTRAGLLAGRN